MPVFKSGKNQAPAWCELEWFEIVELPAGGEHRFARDGKKEKLIVGRGSCQVVCAGREVAAERGANLDIQGDDAPFAVLDAQADTVLIRMCGHWGEETGGSGLFEVHNEDGREDRGDPFDYEKTTRFDSHFHDCDEYWILFEGKGTAVSEGRQYEVEPGDCVATGMGYHHDFPRVESPVRAVYFETTMAGQKRRGHLWEHEHGKAAPKGERI